MAKGFREVALSTRQVFAVLLVIATLISGLVASARYDNEPPEQVARFRLTMGLIAGGCAVLSAGLFLWHARIVRQPDIHPDILAQVFGDDRVFEMDTLHFWASGRQSGARARLVVLLQNVYGERCTGRLLLCPIGTTTKIKDARLPLEFELGPAEVIAAWRDLPVPATTELSFEIDGFIRKVRAPRVRFKRRVAIGSASKSGWIEAGLALTGHFSIRGGNRLNIQVTPPALDAADPGESSPWGVLSLWSPEEPRDLAAVGELLGHLFKAGT
jgi:hypothetical protein